MKQLLIYTIILFSFNAFSDQGVYEVVASRLNIRQSPVASGEKVCSLKEGTLVQGSKTIKNSSGERWILLDSQMVVGCEKTGYASLKFLKKLTTGYLLDVQKTTVNSRLNVRGCAGTECETECSLEKDKYLVRTNRKYKGFSEVLLFESNCPRQAWVSNQYLEYVRPLLMDGYSDSRKEISSNDVGHPSNPGVRKPNPSVSSSVDLSSVNANFKNLSKKSIVNTTKWYGNGCTNLSYDAAYNSDSNYIKKAFREHFNAQSNTDRSRKKIPLKSSTKSLNYCYRYVKCSLLQTDFSDVYLVGASAKNAGTELKKQGFQNLFTALKSKHGNCVIDKAPIGSVLVYSGGKHGHIEVKVVNSSGDIEYVSDYTDNEPRNMHRDGKACNISGDNRTLIGVWFRDK